MTVIYTVLHEEASGGSRAYPTLAEAREAAKDEEHKYVTRIEVAKLPIRQLLCAVYNHEQFAAGEEDE